MNRSASVVPTHKDRKRSLTSEESKEATSVIKDDSYAKKHGLMYSNVFEKDKKDSRLKHVFLNEKGKKLFNEIFSVQKKRIYKAFLNSKSEEVLFFDNVLKKIINE